MKKTTKILYTLLIYSVRKELDINPYDYLVADSIQKLAGNPKNEIEGWCFASKEYLADSLQISISTVKRSINRLLRKDLIEKNKDNRQYLRTTSKWYDTAILEKNKINKNCKEKKFLIQKNS